MRKPDLDPSTPLERAIDAIRENLLIVTGRLGGTITTTKGILVPAPSVGVDVASAGPTQVATSAEFDQLARKVANIDVVLRALISRLNTP